MRALLIAIEIPASILFIVLVILELRIQLDITLLNAKQISVQFKLGINEYRIMKPVITWDGESIRINGKQFKIPRINFAQLFGPKWMKGFARPIMRRLIFDRFMASVSMGIAQDAAKTALLCGTTTAILQSTGAVLTHGRQQIRVQPVFGTDIFRFTFSCIVRLKGRHIIGVALHKLLKR